MKIDNKPAMDAMLTGTANSPSSFLQSSRTVPLGNKQMNILRNNARLQAQVDRAAVALAVSKMVKKSKLKSIDPMTRITCPRHDPKLRTLYNKMRICEKLYNNVKKNDDEDNVSDVFLQHWFDTRVRYNDLRNTKSELLGDILMCNGTLKSSHNKFSSIRS